MKFERVINGKDHLWAVRDLAKPKNELAMLFDTWNDMEYLMQFFIDNGDYRAVVLDRVVPQNGCINNKNASILAAPLR